MYLKHTTAFDYHTIDFILPDVTFPAVLKLSFIFEDQITDKRIHPLFHDSKIITTLVHVLDIFFAEIPSVEDNPRMPVTIATGFFQHEL